MESPDIHVSREEECSESESESGWTFYIDSPKSGHDDDNYAEGVYDYNSGEFAYGAASDDDKDHKSDDSMASDASSCPSQLPSGTSDYIKHGDYEHQRKNSSGNKAKDRGDQRSTKGKREHALKAADSHVRKGSKGRKTN